VPGVVVGVTVIPTPDVDTGSSTGVTAVVVDATITIPAPTLAQGVAVAAFTVLAVTTIPTPHVEVTRLGVPVNNPGVRLLLDRTGVRVAPYAETVRVLRRAATVSRES
jgi:hypothetical protein